MRGLIVNNAYSRLNSALNQSKRLKEEFLKLGVQTDIITSDSLLPAISANGIAAVTLQSENLSPSEKYSFCVYLDKDKYAPRMLEQCGLRLFNRPQAIEVCDDKMLTHITLTDYGINMPPTVPGILCYTPDAPLSEKYILSVEAALGGYPIIVKECYGSLGKQVYKANDREELTEIAERVKCKPHLFQKCVKSSIGKDVRVICIGGKPVAAMLRKSETDFRSNLELGGAAEIYAINDDIKSICGKICKILDLDYCGIDLLFTHKGFAVCEVNSNAFFKGMEHVTGINVAKAYAQYICGATEKE